MRYSSTNIRALAATIVGRYPALLAAMLTIVGVRTTKLCCAAFVAILVMSQTASALEPVICGNPYNPSVWDVLPSRAHNDVIGQPDVRVMGACLVRPGESYHYGAINVLKNGYLAFREHDLDMNYKKDTQTELWATSIVIENGGTVQAVAGLNTSHTGPITYGLWEPYGFHGGTLTIYLYGGDNSVWNADTEKFSRQNQGAICQTTTSSTVGPCGIPENVWNNKLTTEFDLPGGVRDYFYQYGTLYGDGRCTPNQQKDADENWIFVDGKCVDENDKDQKAQDASPGYFGSKVLAVSYGGTLELAGAKGACHEIDFVAQRYPCIGLSKNDPLRTAPAWTRLAADVKAGDRKLRLAQPLKTGGYRPDNQWKWANGDEIVVTTTDYLPGHSELLTIDQVEGGVFVTVADETKIQWPHNGTRYQLKDRLKPAGDRMTLASDLVENGVETRAAVALLTRSIRIVSAGDVDTGPLLPISHFGAHMVIRQGFEKVNIQGVEFKQMGQGGRLAHYPVHFHMARKTPKNTYVKDSSVNESMTRWIVIHSTHGVTLERNIGYKSIGHGFYLEDGTEVDNNFHSNLGIFARAAIENDHNPRKVPGILAANQKKKDAVRFPYLTDSTYPTVFWITNGWNNFIGNMAAGAGGCGTAYWFVPAWNTNHTEVTQGGKHAMEWSGYAALQKDALFQGTTPLKSFYKNFATSTMMSFQTTGDVPPCGGFVKPGTDPNTQNVVRAIESIAPDPGTEAGLRYYPHAEGGVRHATSCDLLPNGTYDCSNLRVPCSNEDDRHCAVTVLDHFTSSFHWAEKDVSAIWLRNQWYLTTNSVLSDVQGGGLTFITGGDYTHASIIKGYWAVARNSVFIGHTQPNDAAHKWSSDAGPFNKDSGLRCEWQIANMSAQNYCLSKAEGITIRLADHGLAQRLFNIYDGPAYQDSNVFLDINTTRCDSTGSSTAAGCMYGTGVAAGLRKDGATCYLPNAAIAWKQSNGFFYPPAFHSTNLFFGNVDIRHYVVDPLFKAPDGVQDFGQGGTYITATSGPNDVSKAYCNPPLTMFDNFSAIDRQTVLNDEDGSLTGLKNTLSINDDMFFSAPVETAECLSNVGVTPKLACSTPPTPSTARTSPYDYVVTAIAPQCSQNQPAAGGYGRCGDNPDNGQGGPRWSGECSNQTCYGVPIYRQLLTKSESTRWSSSAFACDNLDNRQDPKCRWPFIRMAGQNMYQRHTLTLNNARYYIDTSVPLADQQNEAFTRGTDRDVNVFEPDQTYYMFFLYAKPTTKQVYQIYVGDGFDTKSILAQRGDISSAPVKFAADTKTSAWFTVDSYTDQVVTITVDFGKLNDEDKKQLLPQNPKNGQCGPAAFCKWDTRNPNMCVSSLSRSDPLLVANSALKEEADAVCGKWAVKDLDCPAEGCFALSFKLDRNGFKTASKIGQRKRPKPDEFTGWTTKFSVTDTLPDKADTTGSQCYYDRTKPPVSGPCTSAR